MFAIQCAFQFLKKIQKLISMLSNFWKKIQKLSFWYFFLGWFLLLWDHPQLFEGRCGWLWVVRGFSNYGNFYSKKNFSSICFSRETDIRLNDRNLLLETGRAFAEFVRYFTWKVCYDVSLMAIYKIEVWILSQNKDSWESKWRMNHEEKGLKRPSKTYFRPHVDL